MGSALKEDDLAIKKAREIPTECRRYISHHVRNGLVLIMGMAERIQQDPVALKELEDYVKHIAGDLEKVGL